jgi:hypothetical protein
MQPAFRVGCRAVGCREDDAGRADRRADGAGPRDAHPDGAGRLIARPGHDGCPGGNAGEGGGVLGHTRADVLRLEHVGHPAAVDVDSVENVVRPAPLSDIQHQSARGVGDVDRELPAQPETHVVLRQQHLPHVLPDVGLMRANPQELGQREIGERWIRRQAQEPVAADRLVEPAAFGFGALIAPDDRGPQYGIFRIEEHGSVHLSREADARDRPGGHAARRQHRTDRLLRRPPPVVRILLGPAGSRRTERGVVPRLRSEERAVLAHDQRARAAGADVDAQDRHGGLLY